MSVEPVMPPSVESEFYFNAAEVGRWAAADDCGDVDVALVEQMLEVARGAAFLMTRADDLAEAVDILELSRTLLRRRLAQAGGDDPRA
jgi:hypothetical protein